MDSSEIDSLGFLHVHVKRMARYHPKIELAHWDLIRILLDVGI